MKRLVKGHQFEKLKHTSYYQVWNLGACEKSVLTTS